MSTLQLDLNEIREHAKQYRAAAHHVGSFAPMLIEALADEVEKLRAENVRWRQALEDERHFAASKERELREHSVA